MCKTRLYTAITILFSFVSILCATPKLTVVVLVDGLCEDNLRLMQSYWHAGGIRTLSEEAYPISLKYLPQSYGGAENIATLLTGEAPSTHGISMSNFFSKNDGTIHPILEDNNETGIGTMEKLSPRHILSTTLTDRFRLRYGKDARIYSIGQDGETAILMAGHAADACCWMDVQSQKWVSTSFYTGGLPAAADEMNISTRIPELLQTLWVPRMVIGLYNRPTEQELKYSFQYNPEKILLHSPAINTLSVELALAMQKKEELGTHPTPDLLLLQLTLRTPNTTCDPIYTAEQEDQHMCLNQDLGFLMEQIQHRLGQENVQFIVIGVPRMGISVDCMKNIGLPIHQFNVERAAALTSTYLMALYGKEKWVIGGYGQSIYLNHELIEQKRLSLETIEKQVAHFLMDFEGVQIAYPMLEAYLDPQLSPMLTKRSVGDVVFLLQPGWQLTYGDDIILDHLVESYPSAPLLVWPAPTATRNDNSIDANQFLSFFENLINP